MDVRGNRTFENYDPDVEWSRAAEADSVKITLPGFKREEIRVLVDNHGHLRTRGERQLVGTRWSSFQKDFKLPDNCNVDGIRAKFENETLTITLPKKSPSPQAAAAQPAPLPEPRRPAAAPPQRPPQALPEPPKPAPPTPAPAAPLPPAASQKQPAERRPSMPRKPSVPTPAPEVPTPPSGATAAVPKPKEQEPVTEAKKPSSGEDEAKRMEREAMGKLEEDSKAAQEMEKEKAAKQQGEEAVVGEAMDMARRPSRGLLVNVAVAVVVLVGITVYLWHSLRNATGGGDHGHGEAGAGSYGDEM